MTMESMQYIEMVSQREIGKIGGAPNEYRKFESQVSKKARFNYKLKIS